MERSVIVKTVKTIQIYKTTPRALRCVRECSRGGLFGWLPTDYTPQQRRPPQARKWNIYEIIK